MCTHPETNSLGVLKTTIDKLADELNVSYENVFQNLKKMKRLKIIWHSKGYFFIDIFFRYHPPYKKSDVRKVFAQLIFLNPNCKVMRARVTAVITQVMIAKSPHLIKFVPENYKHLFNGIEYDAFKIPNRRLQRNSADDRQSID